jgi:hypothetical protein
MVLRDWLHFEGRSVKTTFKLRNITGIDGLARDGNGEVIASSASTWEGKADTASKRCDSCLPDKHYAQASLRAIHRPPVHFCTLSRLSHPRMRSSSHTWAPKALWCSPSPLGSTSNPQDGSRNAVDLTPHQNPQAIQYRAMAAKAAETNPVTCILCGAAVIFGQVIGVGRRRRVRIRPVGVVVGPPWYVFVCIFKLCPLLLQYSQRLCCKTNGPPTSERSVGVLPSKSTHEHLFGVLRRANQLTRVPGWRHSVWRSTPIKYSLTTSRTNDAYVSSSH